MTKNKLRPFPFFITVIWFIFLFSNLYGAGTTGFNFLRMNIGSRAQGMGNAFTAISSDINGLYFNPASVGFSVRPTLMFYHAKWFEDLSVENLSFIFPPALKLVHIRWDQLFTPA